MKFDLDIESKVAYDWEDNTGTQNVTNSKGPLVSPPTKSVGVKYHWFQSKISLKEIIIMMIYTKRQ